MGGKGGPIESGPARGEVFLSTVLSLGFVFKAVVELLQGCFYRGNDIMVLSILMFKISFW